VRVLITSYSALSRRFFVCLFFFFFQAEDGIRDFHVTGVQTCALPICLRHQRPVQWIQRTWASHLPPMMLLRRSSPRRSVPAPHREEVTAIRGACGGHRPSSGDLPLQVDEPCVFPAVSLPFVIVRLDVAGPTTIPAAGIETNNCPEDFFQLSVGDVNSPASAGGAEFDGAGCH